MIELLYSRDLKSYTAVIPSVCVGNVGQLASDLLISSLHLNKLGYVWHPQVLVFCGAEPFAHSENVSTACEIFFSDELKLIVFQIRSALTKNSRLFLQDTCLWLKENNIKQVIVLSGISGHRRRDRQLVGEPLRYLFCPITRIEEYKKAIERNWIELETENCGNESSGMNLLPKMPGSGAAVKWYNQCIKEKIRCSILLKFCSEGNNAPDALKLVDYLDEWLRLKDKQQLDCWVMPPSWDHLFGSQAPVEIFN